MTPLRVSLGVFAVAIGVGSLPGCKRGAPSAPAPNAAASADAAAVAPAAPVGMKAPFATLDKAAAKSLNAGYKALRAKQYDVARQAFDAVVAARPDYTAARYQSLHAAVLADPNADVREAWRELLLRDFVGYSGRLATKELAALRASPQGADLARIAAEAQAAYAAGLERGFFFVARSRPAKEPFYDEHGGTILDLNEEAYHFDPTSGLIRRLTDTGGRVAGIYADRAHRQLLLLLVKGMVSSDTTTGYVFTALEAAALSLDKLELAGPALLPIEAPVEGATLCTSAQAEPLWVVKQSYTFDATRKAVVVAAAGCPPSAGVRATANRAERLRPDVGSTADATGDSHLVPNGDGPPIRISRPKWLASIGWSPGKKRLVYAGPLDPCTAEPGVRSPQNEIYVWEAATKKATRLASAFSFFDWEWLDDDHLAYETGGQIGKVGQIGQAGKVAWHDFLSQSDTVVDTHAGAGLGAVPSLTCVMPTVEGAGDDDDGAE